MYENNPKEKDIAEHLGHMAVLYSQPLQCYKDAITGSETLDCFPSVYSRIYIAGSLRSLRNMMDTKMVT